MPRHSPMMGESLLGDVDGSGAGTRSPPAARQPPAYVGPTTPGHAAGATVVAAPLCDGVMSAPAADHHHQPGKAAGVPVMTGFRPPPGNGAVELVEVGRGGDGAQQQQQQQQQQQAASRRAKNDEAAGMPGSAGGAGNCCERFVTGWLQFAIIAAGVAVAFTVWPFGGGRCAITAPPTAWAPTCARGSRTRWDGQPSQGAERCSLPWRRRPLLSSSGLPSGLSGVRRARGHKNGGGERSAACAFRRRQQRPASVSLEPRPSRTRWRWLSRPQRWARRQGHILRRS
eukprot:COSAG01_NODE_4023_length_5426_cov_7.423503_3_plen_285_part_00